MKYILWFMMSQSKLKVVYTHMLFYASFFKKLRLLNMRQAVLKGWLPARSTAINIYNEPVFV